MVSLTSNSPGPVSDLIFSSAATTSASTNTSVSFAQQLESALASYFGQSGNGSKFEIDIQQEKGQGSGSGQFLVTVTTPPAAVTTTPGAAATPAPAAIAALDAAPAPSVSAVDDAPSAPHALMTGGTVPSLSSVMRDFATGWSVMTPQQVAYQLANASGTGGGDPTSTVPGTTLTFGQLTQSQQVAYQYALNYGTGGLSMTDFLTQNAGPQAAWNISYNQAQLIPAIQADVVSSYQVSAEGAAPPLQAPQEYGMPPAASGNPDNLPNPAMIQYLPLDQQAAAEAAVAAEGPYGENVAAAAKAYDATT